MKKKRLTRFAFPFCVCVFAVLALFAAGCSSTGRGRKNEDTKDNRMARQLYVRAKKEIRKNDFVPGITDILHAERLCSDETLMLDIVTFKDDVFNHVQVFTSLEGPDTLRYTMLYKRDDVFYPVQSMQVGFLFTQGNGVINESASTNTTGTAKCKLQKITTGKRKIVIESVPIVNAGEGTFRIESFKREFVLLNTSSSGEIRVERIKGIMLDAVSSSIDFIDNLFTDIFGEDDEDGETRHEKKR